MPFVADKTEETPGSFVPDQAAGGFVPDAAPAGRLLGGQDAVISAADEPSVLRRALTATRESLSPLIGPTENQRLRREQEQMALEQTLPAVAAQIAENQPGAIRTEGAVPALFAPNKTMPWQLPRIENMPDIPALGMNNPALLQGIYNPVSGAVNSAVASPGGLLTLPLSAPLSAVPAIGKIVSGGFAVDMARQTAETAPAALQTIFDPNASTAEKTEAVAGTALTAGFAGLAGKHGFSKRLEGKTPEQASKAIREEAKVTEDKATVDKLTDAADTLDREIAARDALAAQQKAQEKALTDQFKALEKAKADQQRALEQQQKAQQDAQKQAADMQAKAQEVPKSTQILQESGTPPPLANIATDIGTQTSPFAVQGKLNELTAVPPPALDQIPGPAQGPAPILSPEQLTGRQRAAAMRRGRDAGPVLDEVVEPTVPTLPKIETPNPTGVEPLATAKANFERRKAIFDAEKKAKKEAEAAQKALEEEAADEARWVADQQRKTAEANDPVKIKEQQVKDAASNPDTQYQFTVQQGGEGYPGYVQVDAILPSLAEGERNTVSSTVKDFNKAGAKLPDVPAWVPQKQYTLDELKAVIEKGEPKSLAEKGATKSVAEMKIGTYGTVSDNPATAMLKIVDEARSTQERFLASKGIDIDSARKLSPESQRALQNEYQAWMDKQAGVDPAITESNRQKKNAIIEFSKSALGKEYFAAYDVADKQSNIDFPKPRQNGFYVQDKLGMKRDIRRDELMARHGLPEEFFTSGRAAMDMDLTKHRDHTKAVADALGIKYGKSERTESIAGKIQEIAIKNYEAKTAPKEAVREPTVSTTDNRYALLQPLNESQLMAVTRKLGVDPQGMSGERLRARLSTNAREADIIDAIANPAPEAIAPKKGKIRGSAADKWAEKKINDSRGQVNSGIDPELFAAHVIRLAGQLESGAIKFGEWSKRMIDEVGESVRPMLGRIWEEAHKKVGKDADIPPEPRIISGAEENRAQSEAITGHEYLKDTNKAQEESGQRYVDYVKKTQDWDGAIDAVERIPHLADRSVAVSQLLAEGNRTLNTPDTLPEFDRLVNRLAPQVLGEKTELGQGLQSQAVVNRIIEPLRPYLGWRRMIQTRLKDLAGKFAPDVAEQINKGMKDAGNEAAKKITTETPSENPLINKAIGRVRKTANIDWQKVFTDLPEKQEARKKEIFDRVNADPALEKLSPEARKKLAEGMEKAWEELRNREFRKEFDKVIKLPNVGREQREVLEKSLPKIVERANLGLMDNEAFLNAIGDKYGIEGIDGPTGKKLRDLGQKAARAPEGIERNEIYQQIMDTIMEARGVSFGDFMKDYWYRNVMSAPRTAVEIGTGGIVQGAVRTFVTAMDTAIGLKRPDIALRMLGMFLKDAGTGARLGFDLIKTGDRAILPRYKEQFMSKMERLEQGKSPGGEIESLYRRTPGVGKALLAPFELTGRVLTGLDYIGGQGVRSQQMLYSALVRGDKASFEAAMKRFNANEVKSAEQQARTEIGPNARPAQIIARSREILNEGIAKDIQAFGNMMTEVTALNAKPVGIGGKIYDASSQIPMVVRAPTGLGFVKAMINLIQESTNWAPGTGQINMARAMWKNPSKNNPFRFLALDKLPPERARQLMVAQSTGLVLMLAAANKFLSDQDEDKEGKPRKWEISGGWAGLSATQKAALMSAGEKPFAFRVPGMDRWVDYKLTPFVASLATIGHWRDQQRFNGKKWNDEELTNKVGNAWLSGLGAVRDLSVSSQFSSLAGHMLASDSRSDDTKTWMRTLTDTVGNSAVGLLPMSSLLRELDQSDDQQRYRPGRKNPGIDLWLSQIPFVRRTVGDGPVLDFLGKPINVEVNPFNRHIGPGPSDDPLKTALSDKVSMGMKLPTLADNTQITEIKDGKPEKRDMTDEEAYNYQKAVRQGFARQLANDLPAFQNATPEQAALYSQVVFTAAEQYARDRLNTGAKFDGVIPVNPKLSSALSPEYQQVKEMDASDSSQSALDRANIRVKYDQMMALPKEQRMSAIRDVAVNNPELARKFLQFITSPTTGRNALEKATGSLDASTRAEFFAGELAKRTKPEEKRAYLMQQFKSGLISKEVLRQLANQSQQN